MVCVYIYNSAIKKSEIMPFAATWMQLEISTVSGVNQRERQILHGISHMGFLSNSVVQSPRATQETLHSLIPGLGRCPGGGNGNPLQDSCLGNPMDRRRAWRATVPKSLTRLNRHTHNLCLMLLCFLCGKNKTLPQGLNVNSVKVLFLCEWTGLCLKP